MRMPSEIEISWFAGFFDGEGSVVLVPTPKGRLRTLFNLRVCISNTHLPTLLIIQNMWGAGSILPRKSKTKPFWAWSVYGRDACSILEASLIFLITKQEHAKFGILFYHWKVKDISIWGRKSRPVSSYEKEKLCKELLRSYHQDITLLEKEVDKILKDHQSKLV